MKTKYKKQKTITIILVSLICGFSINTILLGFTNQQMEALNKNEKLNADERKRSAFIRSLDNLQNHLYKNMEKPTEGSKVELENYKKEVIKIAIEIGDKDFANYINGIKIDDKNAQNRVEEIREYMANYKTLIPPPISTPSGPKFFP